ncbi:MAG: ribosome small subunit-dependent GTPase A [Chloroflexi bacterium]|nr:ribosome small subunit-dependent GTPase A [Chloroflexota bacterium]
MKKRAQSQELKAKKRAQSQELKAKKHATRRDPEPGPRRALQSHVGQFTGVIVEAQKPSYTVTYGDQFLRCDVDEEILPTDGASPVVGDRVTFDIEDGRGIVRHVLPRVSQLVRMRADSTRRSAFAQEAHVLAANVDVAVIVAATVSPPFRPRLIDRYLVMCRYGKVAPIVCMNKCDLVTVPPDLRLYQQMNIPVVYASASTGQGIADLRILLQGKYAVLTGHSGVGKSSLINALLGSQVQAVREVGRKFGRGRHTTTTSSLHRLDAQTYLIDTPGVRALGLWKIDRETLLLYFPEFEQYETECKFRNCIHINEPECGVKAAVARGEIATVWYDSYLRMANE